MKSFSFQSVSYGFMLHQISTLKLMCHLRVTNHCHTTLKLWPLAIEELLYSGANFQHYWGTMNRLFTSNKLHIK